MIIKLSTQWLVGANVFSSQSQTPRRVSLYSEVYTRQTKADKAKVIQTSCIAFQIRPSLSKHQAACVQDADRVSPTGPLEHVWQDSIAIKLVDKIKM